MADIKAQIDQVLEDLPVQPITPTDAEEELLSKKVRFFDLAGCK